MKDESCDYEKQIVEAAIAGVWPTDLAAHRRSCHICDRTAFLTEQLIAIEAVNLPSSGIIWWRHRLRLKRLHTERSLRPILVWERIGLSIGITLLLGLAVVTLAPQLQRISSLLTVTTLALGGLLVSAFLAALLGLLRIGHRRE
jgi:hypothetical protein